MQKLFYVSHNNQDLGPFSREDIETKLKKSDLLATDFVFLEEVDDWVLLSDWLKPPVSKAQPPKNTQPSAVTPPPASPQLVKHNTSKEPTKNNAPTSQVHGQEGSVRFSQGEAKISLKNEKAGVVSLEIIDAPSLELVGPREIKILAGPAAQVILEGPQDVVVGEACSLSLRATDKFGNVDTSFDGSIKFEGSTKVDGLGNAQFKSGLATVKIKHTKAESVEIKMVSSSQPGLDLKKTHKMKFRAGTAVRIEVDAPNEIRAGEEAFVTVRAVDAYGNLDAGYSQTLKIRIGGNKEAQVQMNQGTGSVKLSDRNIG